MAEKLSTKFYELITIDENIFYYNLKLEKKLHNKYIKPKNYPQKEKIWLNIKNIKTIKKNK